MSGADTETLVHGTAVSLHGEGVLITGKSGSGKSTLALELIALGATLVSDDQVHLTRKGDGLLMRAPKALQHRIEARGLGILDAPSAPAWARMVIDLDASETERLPKTRETVILNTPLPLIRRVESPAFASMLYVLLKRGIA